MKELEIKTLQFIRQEDLIQKGDKLLVAVSGGVDSVSLLYVIKDLMNIIEIPAPFVAHVNHKLRGGESDSDQEFVKRLCESFGFRFISKSFDIKELALKEKRSVQDMARICRLDFLKETALKLECNKIATGHNQDDLSETVLMWLTRGAGLRGAAGILPKRENFIRPLLCCTRREIKYFAEKRGIIYVEDSSNARSDYVRNVFRNEVIPLIESRCYNSARKNIARYAELLKRDMDYMDTRAEELAKNFSSEPGPNGELSIEVDDLMCLHKAIQSRVIRYMIKSVAGDLDNVSYLHIEKIMEMCSKDEAGRKRISVPGNIEAIRTYSKLLIRPKLVVDKKEITSGGFNIKYPGATTLEPLNLRVDTELLPGGKTIEKYHFDDKYIAFINFDKVKLPLTIRMPEQGDTFVPLGSTGSKKLSDFFIDNKIPADERWKLPILADSENIIWIIGHRMSELYRLDYSCNNVLMVKVSWM
ncbi:MAG: tRNA lysidine(34) synthetase TilS [Pseudomonadota bacterium]